MSAAGELAALPAEERPTAVFAANDLLAIGVLQAFVTEGLRVPDDVAIIGYDDVSYAASAACRSPRSVSRAKPWDVGRPSCCSPRSTALNNGGQHEHQAVRFSPSWLSAGPLRTGSS